METLFGVSLVVVALLLLLLWRLRQSLDARAAELETARRELDALSAEYGRQSARLAALTGATSDGLILVNADARIEFMNDAAAALLGAGDGTGRLLSDVAWGLNLQPLVDQVLHDGGEALGQTLVKGERAFDLRVRALGKGAQGGALVAVNEITERQRLGRARREFVANISHELRTPVASLQLLAETLAQDWERDHTLAPELIDRLHAPIELLNQLTDELMDLALIESGQAPIKLVTARAADLVNRAAEPLRPQAERKRLALSLDVPADLYVLADLQSIQRVLNNLIHNAIKFTAAGGSVAVRAERLGDNVEFAVSDTGRGIPERDLPRIFERFYKVDRARAREPGELRGTGLGLAIAKHSVEAHGGKIWAESVEGRGSTFYFTLPAAS